MKRLKKVICSLLLLAMVFYFENINASENSIIVGDKELNSTNNIISDGKGGTAKWDSEKNTLTLENFNYVGSGKNVENIGIIDADVEFFNCFLGFDDTDDVKIILKGNNVFKFSFDDSEEELVLFGGFFTRNVTFDGDGSLDLTSFDSNNVFMFMAFYIEGEVTINNISINVDVPNSNSNGQIMGIGCFSEDTPTIEINNSILKFNYNDQGFTGYSLVSYENINIKNTYLEVNYGENSISGESVFNAHNLLLDNSIVKINTSKIEEIKVMRFDDNISINNSKLTIETDGTAFVTDNLDVDNSILNITSDSVTSTGNINFDFSSYNKEGYDVKIDDVSCVDFPDNLNDKHKLVTIIPENEGEYKYDLNAGNMEVLTSNIANYVNLTDIEKEFIGFGNDMLFGLDINDNCKDTDLSLIKDNLDGYIFGKAFDITLYKKLGTDGNKSNISDLTNKIKLSYKLDDSLGVENRLYKILRVHNGNVDSLESTYDPVTKELLFETDKFSTYAIVYKDIIVVEEKDVEEEKTLEEEKIIEEEKTVEEEQEIEKNVVNNPKTGDNAYVYFFGSIFSLVLVVILLALLKKNKIKE